jgi:hypothetical protein
MVQSELSNRSSFEDGTSKYQLISLPNLKQKQLTDSAEWGYWTT